MKLTGTVLQIPSERPYAEAVVLAGPWSAANPSWEESNRMDERYRVTDLFMLQAMGSAEFRLDVTDLVRAWMVRALPNHGLVLRSPEKLPSLLNSTVMTFGPAGPKAELVIYYTYNPKS